MVRCEVNYTTQGLIFLTLILAVSPPPSSPKFNIAIFNALTVYASSLSYNSHRRMTDPLADSCITAYHLGRRWFAPKPERFSLDAMAYRSLSN